MKERLFHSFKIFERVEIDTSEYCLASVKQVVYQLLPYKSAVTMMLIYGIGLGVIFRLISKHRVRRMQKQVKNLCKARKIKVCKKNLKKLALTSCYYSVAFVLVHRVP